MVLTSKAVASKVMVLGGGVIGVTSAYYLAQAGYEVTVVEQQEDVAQVGSFANGAQLCYSCIGNIILENIDPTLAANTAIWQQNYPHILNLASSKEDEKLSIINQTFTTYRNNLFAQSALEFQDLINNLNLNFPYQNQGILPLFFTKRSFSLAKHAAKYKARQSVKLEILTPQECLHKEPNLAAMTSTLVGGIFMQQDGTGDAYEFTNELAKVCKKLGVKFVLNAKIVDLNLKDNKIVSVTTNDAKTLTADAFVVCLGTSSNDLLAKLNIDLPMEFVKGYSLSIELDSTDTVPNIGIADPTNEIFYAKLGNSLRVAGLTERNVNNYLLSEDKINILLKATNQLFPDLKIYEKEQAGKVRTWACVRPSAIAKVPFIMPTDFANLFINTGHGGYGWTLAPGSGKLLANLMQENLA